MALSRPGRRPGEWQVPMPRRAGPEEWAEWLERYRDEVAATGGPLETEEAVLTRFGQDVELVDLRVKGVGGPPPWAVRHAAQGVRAVEAWLRDEGFPVRRTSQEHGELDHVLARLPGPSFLPDLLVGDRHAFFLEVRRTSVTTSGRYSRLAGTGEVGLDSLRVEAFGVVEEVTGMPVFILFLDEPLRRAYGNWLSELMAPRRPIEARGRAATGYPRVRWDRARAREVTCFPYPDAFRPMASVTSGRHHRLARANQRDVIRIEGHPEF